MLSSRRHEMLHHVIYRRMAQREADLDDAEDGAEGLRRHRSGTRLLRSAVVLVLAVYAIVIRPRLLTWGATTEETAGTYPGDELVPDPDGGATMATTLPAPPEKVWSWLVQMGGERAGWYSWDWLDNDRDPERGPRRSRMAEPRGATASAAAAQGPDELVDRGDPGAEPHHGAAGELRLDRPILRSAVRSGASRIYGGDLGLPPSRRS
jgi:hypothetical protein